MEMAISACPFVNAKALPVSCSFSVEVSKWRICRCVSE